MDFDRILAGHDNPRTQTLSQVIADGLANDNNPLIKQHAQAANDALQAYQDAAKQQDLPEHTALIHRKAALDAATTLCTSIAMQENFEHTQQRTRESKAMPMESEFGPSDIGYVRHGPNFASTKPPAQILVEAKRRAEELFAAQEEALGLKSSTRGR